MREHVRQKVAAYLAVKKQRLRDNGRAVTAAWAEVQNAANAAELAEIAGDGISPPAGFTSVELKYGVRGAKPQISRAGKVCVIAGAPRNRRGSHR